MRQRARVTGGVGVVLFHLLALSSSCHTILGLTGAPEDSVSSETDPLRPDGGTAGSSGRSSAIEPPLADPADPCTTYCTAIASVCTGALRQYANPTDCAKLCPELQRGDGKALRCRSTALTEYGETGCATAGPTGRTMRQGVPSCVDDACETYCDLMRSTCADTSLGEPDDPSAEDGPTAADRAACRDVCASVPGSPDYSVSPSLPAGNNINCRIHHINLAVGAQLGSEPRKDHCEHAAGRAGLFALTTVPCQER
jgi:hypothetical protein